jgi:SAM-dependent methyltransferase
LGCGTGTNVNYLSTLGFTAIGVDIAWLAVQRARTRALQAGLQPRFCVGDVSDVDFLAVQAIFALDMGCLHSLAPDDRVRYARSMARCLMPGGLYLLYGFEQDVLLDSGPGGFAPGEIMARFAPNFRLEWHKPSKQGDRSVAWYLLRRVPTG